MRHNEPRGMGVVGVPEVECSGGGIELGGDGARARTGRGAWLTSERKERLGRMY
jgi:hypothetical protein